MDKRFLEILEWHKLVKPKDVVLLGISGGVDSIVLFDLFKRNSKKLSIKLVATHINHGMRTTAKRDEKFVKELCRKNKTTLFTGKIFPPKNNIEEILREKRYEILNAFANEIKADRIAVAHHFDDNIETALMNLLRGASFKGLSGMKLKSGNLIRPLLPFSKEEILVYAKKNKLKWIEDETNLDIRYLRNRIRNEIIPELTKSMGVDFKTNFSRFMMLARETDEFLKDQAERALSQIEFPDGSLNLKAFKLVPSVLQKEIIKIKVEQKIGDLKGVGSVHLESAVRTLSGEHSPKTIEFPRGLKIFKRSAKVSFEL